jgi:hypothetical protein
MSQCHDIYSWDGYRGEHRDAPEGTQCHDPDESVPSEAILRYQDRAGRSNVEATHHEVQPA